MRININVSEWEFPFVHKPARKLFLCHLCGVGKPTSSGRGKLRTHEGCNFRLSVCRDCAQEAGLPVGGVKTGYGIGKLFINRARGGELSILVEGNIGEVALVILDGPNAGQSRVAPWAVDDVRNLIYEEWVAIAGDDIDHLSENVSGKSGHPGTDMLTITHIPF